MKTCQTCGNQNADDMRFCLNCGKPLPDAPIVFNLQDSGSQGQSGPGTNPYGKSMETQFGGNRGFVQNQFSMVPPPRKSGSKKIFIALGGVVALLFLVVAGVGGIIGYNYWIKPTPTPAWTPTPAATPTATPTPSKSATATPKPIDTPRPSDLSNVKVKFSKVWVDYNVTKDGEMGMRVHVKFDVSNMKGVDSNVIIYFQKEDNSFILGGVGNYRGKDGRIAVFQPIRPAYDNTVYTDLEIFVPYSELNQSLSKGKYNLKMDIDLTDDDENQIEHLTLHDFKYEKF